MARCKQCGIDIYTKNKKFCSKACEKIFKMKKKVQMNNVLRDMNGGNVN